MQAGPVSDQDWLHLPHLQLRAESVKDDVSLISLLKPHLHLSLNISLWSRGSVEVQALIDHVTECANEVLVEYALETYFKVNTVALAASEVSVRTDLTMVTTSST